MQSRDPVQRTGFYRLTLNLNSSVLERPHKRPVVKTTKVRKRGEET